MRSATWLRNRARSGAGVNAQLKRLLSAPGRSFRIQRSKGMADERSKGGPLAISQYSAMFTATCDLVFKLCRQRQLHKGRHLSGIFAWGDLGRLPNLCLVDRATARRARRDPEELNLGHYFAPPEPPLLNPLLERTLFAEAADLNTVKLPAPLLPWQP